MNMKKKKKAMWNLCVIFLPLCTFCSNCKARCQGHLPTRGRSRAGAEWGVLANLMSKRAYKSLQKDHVCACVQKFCWVNGGGIYKYLYTTRSWHIGCSTVSPQSMYTNGNLQACAGHEFFMVWEDRMRIVFTCTSRPPSQHYPQNQASNISSTQIKLKGLIVKLPM